MSTEPRYRRRRAKKNRYHFDRHTPEYREQFDRGHRRDAGQVPGRVERHLRRPLGRRRAPARCSSWPGRPTYLSNDHDLDRRAARLQGHLDPVAPTWASAAASWRWTRPSSGTTGRLLNPYLSPAAVARWTPLVDEIVRASLNEKIETGRIDFVDDLANIVPAVLTLAMLGHAADELGHLRASRSTPRSTPRPTRRTWPGSRRAGSPCATT